jgi:hypothetical protein
MEYEQIVARSSGPDQQILEEIFQGNFRYEMKESRVIENNPLNRNSYLSNNEILYPSTLSLYVLLRNC